MNAKRKLCFIVEGTDTGRFSGSEFPSEEEAIGHAVKLFMVYGFNNVAIHREWREVKAEEKQT